MSYFHQLWVTCWYRKDPRVVSIELKERMQMTWCWTKATPSGRSLSSCGTTSGLPMLPIMPSWSPQSQAIYHSGKHCQGAWQISTVIICSLVTFWQDIACQQLAIGVVCCHFLLAIGACHLCLPLVASGAWSVCLPLQVACHKLPAHEFHETCHAVTFIVLVNSQPKMKPNTEPRLLSSLVWIDSGIMVSQHRLESFIQEIECNRMTSFMEFMIW